MLCESCVGNSSDFQSHAVGEVLFWRGAAKHLQHEPDSLGWHFGVVLYVGWLRRSKREAFKNCLGVVLTKGYK